MNYENFARPESELAFEPIGAPGVYRDDVMDDGEEIGGYPCQECGTLCDGNFCSNQCYHNAQTGYELEGNEEHQEEQYYYDDQPEWME